MDVDEFSIKKFRAGMIVWAIRVQTYGNLPAAAPSIILIKVFES
jgi:hypothetical protein